MAVGLRSFQVAIMFGFAVLSAAPAMADKSIECKAVEDCLTKGQNLFDGRGVKRDVDRARLHMAEACNQNYAEACFSLGQSYTNIVGEAEQSIPHFERACALGLIEGCNNVAVYLSKFGNATDEDHRRGNAAFKILCDNDIGSGCRNLAISYVNGFGVEVDEEAGETLLQKACDLESCPFGYKPKLGVGTIRPTVVKRLQQLEAECEESSVLSICEKAALLHMGGDGVEENDRKGIEILSRVCDAGNAESCWKLGQILLFGRRVDKDASRGILFLKRGCDLGKSYACLDIADALQSAPELTTGPDEADAYKRRACVLGDAESCT
jgi:TPR repeat protein